MVWSIRGPFEVGANRGPGAVCVLPGSITRTPPPGDPSAPCAPSHGRRVVLGVAPADLVELLGAARHPSAELVRGGARVVARGGEVRVEVVGPVARRRVEDGPVDLDRHGG